MLVSSIKEENLTETPERHVELNELRVILKDAMLDLNEREKKIVFLY